MGFVKSHEPHRLLKSRFRRNLLTRVRILTRDGTYVMQILKLDT